MTSTIFVKDESFSEGVHSKTELTNKKCIVLVEGAMSGTFRSDEIHTSEFKNLIASWNTNTHKNAFVELLIQIRVDGKWSEWFSYGKWSDKGNNKGSIKDQKCDLAVMDVDVISVIKGVADALKFEIKLSRNAITDESPVVRNVSFSMLLNSEKKQCLLKTSDVNIEVPQRTQMVIEKIGNHICSPTSLSMVMEYLGVKETTEEVANGCFDNGEKIFGNWSYNVAYASERGFDAYVKRCNSINEVLELIEGGKPLIASVKTKEKDELKGAPQSYPSGHLLVIRGITKIDDSIYLVVNDPASPPKENIKRYYRLEQFVKVWSKIVYVVDIA